ncbi:MAG TPA: ATP-binding protein [Candidatus Limnocylindria bacterium]|nr:ATP-binding protein [Candidatus Limnocylindria bacterium]
MILLVVGAQLPVLAMAVGLVAYRPSWLSPLVVSGAAAALIPAAVVLALLLERRTVRFMTAISAAAKAIARGEQPAVPESSIRELDDVARSLAAAGRERTRIEEQRRRIEEERAQLLRRERAARARFAALVEGLDAIVWEADPATHRFTFVSQRAEALLGYPVQRWLDGDFWITTIAVEDREAALAQFLRCGREVEQCRFEYRAVAADGRLVWLSNVVRVARASDGTVDRLHGFMMDVSERRQIEEERARLLDVAEQARAEAEAATRRAKFLAEASEALASSLDYEATLDAVARLAVPAVADWCFVRLADEGQAPARLQAAHADPREATVADRLRELASGLDVGGLAPALEMLGGGQPLLLPEISPAWLETARLLQELAPRSAMIVPLVARGRTIGTLMFVSSHEDRRYGAADLALAGDLAHRAALAVDNARLYQEAQRANRAKDEFVATLSHELRTPLTAMLGWTMMLQSGRLGADECGEALAHIERNTRAQTRLIDELLDVSRIVSGKLDIDKQPVDLAAIVRQAVESVRRDADARSLRLRCLADTPVSVLGDAGRIEQIVVNLVGNAVKFTPEHGHVDVTLDRHQASARLVVTDSGRGIEPDVLPHIFERFRQADGTTTRRHAGLGLGLAIVQHLVGLHGGTVHAHSDGIGAGATFTVRLPVLAVRALPEETAAPPARLPRLDAVRILAVDDDADARRLVETVLRHCGAHVTLAASVEEALAILRASYVDVAVSDIGMPNADGYALIQQVRAMEREHGGRLPAIALTAYAGADDRERAIAAGFDCHVTKPITPSELAEAVARTIGRPVMP